MLEERCFSYDAIIFKVVRRATFFARRGCMIASETKTNQENKNQKENGGHTQ